jgi:Flp pilus assembly protein TadG
LDQGKNLEAERGRTLVLLPIAIVAVIILAGVAIDLVRGHVAKTKLSKAAEAAALVAVRDLDLGRTEAAAAARTAFRADAHSVPALLTTTEARVIWLIGAPCVAGGTCARVDADAAIATYFLRLIGFDTLKISASGIAQRAPIVMSLVLDKSNSMNFNKGAGALPPAVIDFAKHFIVGIDQLAEISFSSIASVDVPMTTSFEAPIADSVEHMSFYGGTFAQAGLQDGFDQIRKTSILNSIRIVVFFTDGWANIINDTLNCGPAWNEPDVRSINFGGCAPLEAVAGWCSSHGSFSQVFFMDPQTGEGTPCARAFTFPAQAPPGGTLRINSINVANEATYRTQKLAETMRANRITTYSIGLGDKINQPSLQIIANDPPLPPTIPTSLKEWRFSLPHQDS